MKFGKYLVAEQVPEWAKMYVDYVGLKRAVAAVAAAVARQQQQRQAVAGERMSLLRRTSTYLGYSSFTAPDAPPARSPPAHSSPATQCSSGSCGDTGCNHFGGVVSATPQIAMRLSASNSGKVSATPPDLVHNANIKIPLSARDSFTEAVWTRRPSVASDRISA
ncbi:Xenotropic and polytropic retrovirus receptor 1, partial [Coemansia helicoidea]